MPKRPRRDPCTLILVLIVLPGFLPAESFGNDPFTIMSYNLRFGEPDFDERAAAIQSVIFGTAHNPDQTSLGRVPDILVVQEARFGRHRHIEFLDGILGVDGLGTGSYASVRQGNEGGTSGEATAVYFNNDRFDLATTSIPFGFFWLSDTTPNDPGSLHTAQIGTDDEENPRIVTWVKLQDAHTGRDFALFNSHWSVNLDIAVNGADGVALAGTGAGGEALLRFDSLIPGQAEILRSQIDQIADGLPVIVTGDFNSAAIDDEGGFFHVPTDTPLRSSTPPHRSRGYWELVGLNPDDARYSVEISNTDLDQNGVFDDRVYRLYDSDDRRFLHDTFREIHPFLDETGRREPTYSRTAASDDDSTGAFFFKDDDGKLTGLVFAEYERRRADERNSLFRGRRIDHIEVTDHFRTIDAQIDHSVFATYDEEGNVLTVVSPSDHYPVWAKLEFSAATPGCDFNGNQFCDGADIDQLMTDAVTGGSGTDLTGDGIVDDADRDQWLAQAGLQNGFAEPLLVGDSDINGIVDAIDLNALALNWLNPKVFHWTSGNFSTVGGVGVNSTDLNSLALNWQTDVTAAAATTATVPESSGAVLLLGLAGSLSCWFRRR